MVPLLKLARELEHYPLDRNARGIVRLFSFDEKTGRIARMVEKHNLILFDGADILARVLTGDPKYAVGTMYMEFKNTTLPITPPVFDRGGGAAYYAGLQPSSDVDFLRIPLTILPTIEPSDSNYEGNQITFFGISEGSTGFWGRAFNPTVHSKVYGAALVATPDISDQSQDKVFSRVYSGIDEIPKELGFGIGITWVIRFN